MPGEVDLGTDDAGLVRAPSGHRTRSFRQTFQGCEALLLTLASRKPFCCAGDNVSGGAPTT